MAKALGVSKEWLETGTANSSDVPSVTVTSTKQGPDSYEVTFAVDPETAAIIESSAKSEGIDTGAFLKRLVLQQMERHIRNHSNLSKEQIESIAVEVKALIDADKR